MRCKRASIAVVVAIGPLLIAGKIVGPTFPDLARDEGLPAVAEALTQMIDEARSTKRLVKDIGERGISEVSLPVVLRGGAELVLSEPTPLGGCVWDGTVKCTIEATAAGTAAPEDYQAVCRSRFGSMLALDTLSGGADGGVITWQIEGVERCWELGGVEVKLQPVALMDLEGIGEGDEYNPPELVELAWPEVERIIVESGTTFQYCYKKRADEIAGLAGKLTVAFEIGEDGSIADVSTKKTTLEDEEVIACVHERFRRLRFPPPMGGFTSGEFSFNFQ